MKGFIECALLMEKLISIVTKEINDAVAIKDYEKSAYLRYLKKDIESNLDNLKKRESI